MIKINVESTETRQRMSKLSKPYYKQTAWAYLVDRDGVQEPYPTKIEFMVEISEKGQPLPLPKGFYTINPSSFRVDRFSGLEIGYLNLSPVRDLASKASS